MPDNKCKVYLCSRVRHESRPFNNRVADSLKPFFEVYVPHEQKPNNPVDGRFDPHTIFALDYAAMNAAQLCVVAGGDVGKDCAWEIGWFYAKNIPIYFVENGKEDYKTSPMLIPALNEQVISDPDASGKEIQRRFNKSEGVEDDGN